MGRYTITQARDQKYFVAPLSEEAQGVDGGSSSESTEAEGFTAPRRSPLKVASIVTAGLVLVVILGLAMAGRGETAPDGSPSKSLELLSVCPEHPTDPLTAVCACGATEDCAQNKYCYGRRFSSTATCEDNPYPCTISTTDKVTLNCKCGTSDPVCTLTQYCYGSTPKCETLPQCVESTTVKNSAPFCSCVGADGITVTATDATNPYCYDGGIKNVPKECTPHFTTANTETCKCGSTSPCAKGRFCYGPTAAATGQECNAEAKSCPESSTEPLAAADGPCKCGETGECAVSKYCYRGMCESNPMECLQSTTTKLDLVCKCGSTTQCQIGNYCYDGQCEREAKGTTVDLSFIVTGIDYAKLELSQNLLSDFQVATRDAIARTATHGCTKDDVSVVLSAGSVKVEATIDPPAGISAASVHSTLESASSSLGSNVQSDLEQVADIDTVKTGGAIGVVDIATPTMSSPALAPTPSTLPTPMPGSVLTPSTQPTPIPGPPSVADLEWWSQHGSKYSGEGFQDAAENAKQALETLEMKQQSTAVADR